MEDLYNTTTLWNDTYDDSFGNVGDTDDEDVCPIDLTHYVPSWIMICIGFPSVLLAIYALYSMVRKDFVAPIYVINLLISDLMQLCCSVLWVSSMTCKIRRVTFYIFYLGLMASIGFMVCVAMERYLVIAWPLWYRFRRSIKASVVVCVVVWVHPLTILLPVYFSVDIDLVETMFGVFLLLPLPLFIFFLVGTIKALSAARSVSSDEKRRIVATLVTVLLIYTLLFLPEIIWCLAIKDSPSSTFYLLAVTLVQLSPLADLTLYIFMRKGVAEKLLTSLCHCTAVSQNNVNNDTMHTQTVSLNQ